MASLDLQLKVQIVRKSMATFAGWLDSCDRLLRDVPAEMKPRNSPQLRELALRFKDLLLQMKERCVYMQEINTLSKEIASSASKLAEPLEKTKYSRIPTEVREMNERFTSTCMQAKQQYSILSTLLAAAIAKKEPTRPSSNSAQGRKRETVASVAETTTAEHIRVDGYEEKIRSLEGSPVIAGRRHILADVSARGQGRKPAEGGRKAVQRETPTTTAAVQGRGGRTNDGYTVKVLPSKSKSKSKPRGKDPPHPDKPTSSSTSAPSSSTSGPTAIQNAWNFSEGVDGGSQASGQKPLGGLHKKPPTAAKTEASRAVKAEESPAKTGPKPPVPAKSSHLRERMLAEKSLANAKPETPHSDKKPGSDKWETVSMHSLQNRIVYSTSGAAASAGSMDSLDFSGLSTPNTELSQELDTSDLLSSSPGNSWTESMLEMRDKNERSSATHSSCNHLDGTKSSTAARTRNGSLDAVAGHPGRGNINKRDLGSKLAEMSAQIQDFVHSIAEHKTCGLQSLALELHLGEIKAMLTLLEVQEMELVRLRATFSPSAQWQLKEEQGRGKVRANSYYPTYPANEISTNREEILKLTERVELLRKHCSDTVTQTEEVLEFVMQFEGEVKIIRVFLSSCRKTVEEARRRGGAYSSDVWTELKESLTAVSKYKTQLASIEQLSALLLCLEPIFDGDPIRQEIQDLNNDFQNLVLVLFGQLEVQARNRTEQLLLEMSVMSSWATETELSVQALEKRSRNPNGMSTKIAATRETLIKELQNRKASLQAVSEQLQPITAVLSPDQHPTLKDLLAQLKSNSSTLSKIEKGLHSMFIQPKVTITVTSADASTDSAGLKVSGQEDVVLKPLGSDQDKGSQSPPQGSQSPPQDAYDGLEPFASPLTEDDQVPSRALDSAIESLPKQPQPLATQRRGYVDVDISPYDRPRLGNTESPSHRPLLGHTPPLHEQLLQFISKEWAGLPKEVLESQDVTALRDSVGCLGNPIDRNACTEFIRSLDKLHASLKAVHEHIPLIKIPPIPDLGHIHSAIDQCQKLQTQLERAHPLLGQHNEESLSLLLSLPRGALSSRVSQLLEIRLFDVSMIWHTANMQVAAKLRELRVREGDVNTLHRQLATLSRTLNEAKELLSQKQSVTDVRDYLSKCREMHGRLSDLSVQRGEVASEIRESITQNPQSPLCQNLLDELGEIDTQWVNTVTALVDIPVLEPILIKQMCSNVAKEMAAMETTLQELEGRGLNLEAVREKCLRYQDCVKQAKRIHTSLSMAEVRIKELQSLGKVAEQKDSTDITSMAEKVNLTQTADLTQTGVTSSASTPDQPRGSTTSHQNGIDSTSTPDQPRGSTTSHQNGIGSASTPDQPRGSTTSHQNGIGSASTPDQPRGSTTSHQNGIGSASTPDQPRGSTTSHQNGIGSASTPDQPRGSTTSHQNGIGSASTPDQPRGSTTSHQNGIGSANTPDQPRGSTSPHQNGIGSASTPDQPRGRTSPHQSGIGSTSTPDQPRGRTSPHQSGIGSASTPDQPRGRTSPHQNGIKGSSLSTSKPKGSKAYVEMAITPYGPQLASINYDQLLQSCLSVLQEADKIVSEAEENSAVVENDRSLLERFYKELKELQLWARDTKAMLQVDEQLPRREQGGTSQHRTKNQAICHQVVARQPKIESLQSLSAEVLSIPSSGAERAGQGRTDMENSLTNLYCDWDEICQQCVPAGVLPLIGAPLPHGFSLQAPSEFEDASQMLEWLILVESKLQPEKIIIGDFVQVRSVLRELQLIERELEAKEIDFKRFMTGGRGSHAGSCTSPDLMELLSLQSESQTPVPCSTPSPKCVKFVDEDSLERELRIQDIQEEIVNPETPNPYSQNPYPVFSGMEWEQQHFGMEPRMKQSDSQSTISPSLSQMASPTSSMPDELYQLSILWNGIWTTLTQKRQKLESTLGIWRAFEAKKEAFYNFLTKAEERMSSFFVTLSSAKDLTVMQAKIMEQKGFVEEVYTHKQQLSTLKDLAQDLVTYHHSNDDTHDLQDAMHHINNRWKMLSQSLSQHHPTINALCSRWGEFYTHFHSFYQWLRNMDIEMSNLNPFVGDMATVRSQLTKLKEIQQELNSHEGALETIRLQAYKLLQGIGGCHVNAAAIHSKLDNMARRWDHLEKLAKERKSALEQALTEKQDLLARVADCLAWLNQAERHLANQRPLGADYHRIHEQYEVHQGFWKETQEQKPKMETVITAGKQVAMELPWSGGVSVGEGLRAQCSAIKERWERVWQATEQWGETLEKIHPEMEQFQVLYSEGAQQLTDAEMQAANFEPVSPYTFTLQRQLDMLQLFESTLVSVGNVLEDIVASQKRQLEIGVKVAPDLIQMVKRFHQRWNQLKQLITDRRSGIERGLQKYDLETLGVASVPRGWHRAKTESGTPYYINALAGNKSQWSHPELSTLYHRQRTMHALPSYPNSAYPIALKLRAVQRVTQLNLLKTRHALEAFTEHECHTDPHRILSGSDMALLALSMFQQAEEEPLNPAYTGSPLDIEDAVELALCWLRDVYDVAHEGEVSCLSFQVAVLCMSQGKLEEKYKGLFKVIARNQDSIDLDQLTEFLEQAMQVPQSVSETQYCSLHEADVSAKECFKQHVGVGRLLLPRFISWLQSEPKPLAWLSVLHRLAASEEVRHDAKCTACKTYPIVGFRYRCLQCSGLDMCQNCYWAGKKAKGHDRSKHFMEEFCVARNSGDEVKDFLKLLHRSFRKKKKPLLQQEDILPQVVGDHAPHHAPPPLARATSPPARRRHSIRSSVRIRDLPESDNSSAVQSSKPTTSEGAGHGNMAFGRPLPPIPRSGDPCAPPTPPRVLPKLSRRQEPQQEESGARQQEVGGARGQERGGAKKLDASLSRITEENRHLSKGLQGLRERRESTSSSIGSQTDGGDPPSPEQVMKQRTSLLQGRVDLLQEHNQQLESCIRQLKMIATMSEQVQQLRPVEVPSPQSVNGMLSPTSITA